MNIFKKLFLVLPVILIFAGCSNSNSEFSRTQNVQISQSSGEIVIEVNNINVGEIPIMGGDIDISFVFKNAGDEPVSLLEGETSCMCTEAVVKNSEGVISPRMTMRGHGASQAVVNQILEPGESAILIATYDPLAHGPNGIGPIKRDIFIKTNSIKTPEIRFSFQGNVIQGNKKTKDIFSFTEQSFDFKKIKQSGGKVSHDFEFTYYGKEEVKITGVPTSCACTLASVTPTTLQPGESGVLTVIFNPNLHDEPEGRFFKTVSLLTEPQFEEIPEVKIWTEIDLDLGREAFELQSKHDDSF
ncbi:hypothetical protein COB57_02780 [Candidatus Peregrinibacteria bacterium]|nr:MAG: hypothetical protein COB57_02780 [Candidatus Peregrinibacteria bacterium]